MVKIIMLPSMWKVYRMKWLNKKNIRKWFRLIHRDLGYFVVGITLVYAISGIILNHKEPREDPAYKTITVNEQLKFNLTISEFNEAFLTNFPNYKINKIIPEDNRYQLYLQGGVGHYDFVSGQLFFEIYKKKPLIYFLNKLHYNQKNYWTTPADFFALALIFLALSGMIMVRGKKGIAGRGLWYVLSGVALVILYIWL